MILSDFLVRLDVGPWPRAQNPWPRTSSPWLWVPIKFLGLALGPKSLLTSQAICTQFVSVLKTVLSSF